jgi:hypothetical protein
MIEKRKIREKVKIIQYIYTELVAGQVSQGAK